jgi:hypothetical protein
LGFRHSLRSRRNGGHGYMRRTIPRNALALSKNYCLAGATAISLPKSKFIVQ